jgi:hypothetical protein
MSEIIMNRLTNSSGRKERRAVGAIIGGVILAAIMVTTVLVYFLTILNNEKAKTGYELDAAQANQEQAAEKMIVVRATELSGTNISIRIDNEGSQSLILSKLLVYCISAGCPSPEPSVESPGLTLNGGESDSRLVPVQNGLTYRIDVISERGNIVSAKECKVNFGTGICENDPGDEGEEPPCVTCAVNEGIVQGTGSLQLDFRAFGSIYPQLGARDDIDQRGWTVKTASSYGSVTGYPAFEIPYQAHVFFVERVRNLDPSGEDISLTRKTALITNQGTVPSGQQSVVYLCSLNPVASDGVDAYNEGASSKLIPNTPIEADKFEGWEEIVFCTENPGTDYARGNDSCGSSAASSGYCPSHTNEQLNGIIMVARGAFTSTLSQYGQTIPYQSAQPGSTPFTTFYWCLYDNPTGVACPAPMTDSTAGQLIYSTDSGSMTGGLTIYAHYRGTNDLLPNPGATITWIEPNGNTIVLANNQTPNGQNNIPILLPQTYSDGGELDCDGKASEDFIIKVNDSYGADGTRNVYYMTFRMTCQ